LHRPKRADAEGEDGGWKWGMENGRWRMENGKWIRPFPFGRVCPERRFAYGRRAEASEASEASEGLRTRLTVHTCCRINSCSPTDLSRCRCRRVNENSHSSNPRSPLNCGCFISWRPGESPTHYQPLQPVAQQCRLPITTLGPSIPHIASSVKKTASRCRLWRNSAACGATVPPVPQ